jgi:mono/diheme cytochrome c family protein
MTRLTLTLLTLAGLPGLAFADAKNPTYNDDVLPVIRQHCAGCHGADKQKGGLNLATYGVAMQGGSSGAVVAPGNPDKSRLYTMTAHKEEPVMPPSKTKIPDAQLAVLRLWIEQGGKETATSTASVAVKPKVEIGLKSVGKGKPAGPPPMPLAGKLKLDPLVRARRPGAVLGLATSPWAPLVAVGGQKQVILYHADTGDMLGVLPFEHGQINSIKFSRNAKFLLVAGGRGGMSGKAVLYNVETGEKVTEVGSAETDAVLTADVSADQTMVAVGTTTRMVRIYATADGAVLSAIKKHTDWVTAVEFSPDGVLLATADRNGGAFVWEAATAREFHTLRGHTAMITEVSWRADSNLLATGSLDGTVRLWEMENGGQVKNWPAHPAGVEGVRFSMDGRLASTGRDKLTKLWDANGAMQKQFAAMPDIGLRVAVSHDNTKVVGGDWGGAVQLWNLADAKLIAQVDANPAPMAEQIKAAELAVAATEVKAKQQADALAAVQAKVAAATAGVAAATANLAKATADLAAAQKGVADPTAAATTLTAQLPAVKAEADKQVATVGVATNKAAALEVIAPIVADVLKRIAEAAAKAPQNPDLAAAGKAAADANAKQQADLVAGRKALLDATAIGKAATDKLAAHAKAIADNQAVAVEAQKKVAALTPTIKPATDAVPVAQKAAADAVAAVVPVKAAADGAGAELVAAKAKLERLRPTPKK